ncbi:hypothetical protein [Streptomyces venezuelae]|uniref:hypothetical protein n=1 Tax=Streptomyces venezuelae TaxID=54571 RepID=UPI0037D1A2C5
MSPARTPRPRLTMAVAVALAVTTAGPTAPAFAAPSDPVDAPVITAAGRQDAQTGVADGQDTAVPTFPGYTRLIGNGPSGFLTRDDKGLASWTRYADGVTVPLSGVDKGTVGADTVLKSGETVQQVVDMSGRSSPVTIDIGFLGPRAYVKDLVGSTLVVSVPRPGDDFAHDIHLVGRSGGEVVDRIVSGLPTDVRYFVSNVASPDVLTLLYPRTVNNGLGYRVATVDVATATVVDDRDATRAGQDTDVTVSATHLAWVEDQGADGAVALQWVRRGETEPTRLPIGFGNRVQAELMGDWLAYAQIGGDVSAHPNPLHGLSLRSLTAGRTVKVLDTVTAIRSQSDTELLVHGGTVEHGEGIYRIAPGPDGLPAATFVASMGKPTALTLVSEEVPESVDLDAADARARFSWTFGRGGADVRLTLTHAASGRRWTSPRTLLDDDRATVDWTGLFDNGVAAFHGTYTWKMTATPFNGIGTVERTGTLEVGGKPHPHDYSDSGSPDLLVTNGAGRLLSLDIRQMTGNQDSWERTDRGLGWNIYDRVVATGNLAGSAHADLLGRDRNGGLWFYRGIGHSLAGRTKVGSGWQIYDKLAAGSDLTGDGRPDLVATDKAGALWLYRATGKERTPFTGRERIGTGWGVYNQLTATGNIGGGTAGDLVARDKTGVLWLYPGKSDGTLAPRVRLGGGWNQYTDLVGIGDADKDGQADLLAVNRQGGTIDTWFLYKGTGDHRSPFKARTLLYSSDDAGRGSVHIS